MTNKKDNILRTSEKKRGALYREDTKHVESQDKVIENAVDEEE